MDSPRGLLRLNSREYVNEVDKKLWNASFDTALTAFIAIKLEQLLTDLLTELVYVDPEMLSLLGSKKKPYIRDEERRLKKLSADSDPIAEKIKIKEFLRNVKTLTLGSLIVICFDEKAIESQRKLGLFNRGKDDMTLIKDTRNSMLHYGQRALPHNLIKDESNNLIDRYGRILDRTWVFRMLYHGKIQQMQMDYWSIVNVDDYRSILDAHNRLVHRLKEKVD